MKDLAHLRETDDCALLSGWLPSPVIHFVGRRGAPRSNFDAPWTGTIADVLALDESEIQGIPNCGPAARRRLVEFQVAWKVSRSFGCACGRC